MEREVSVMPRMRTVAAFAFTTLAGFAFATPSQAQGSSPSAASQAQPAPTPSATEPPGSAGASRTIVTAAFGIAALGALAAAIPLGIQASKEADTATSLNNQRGSAATSSPTSCPPAQGALCASENDAIDAHKRDLALSVVFYSAAASAAVLSVVSWFAWPSRSTSDRAQAWIAPMVGDRDVGVAAGGRF